VYCTEDDSVQTVGSVSAAGKQSPRNMWVSTITDELRMSSNFKSKVIGIALKDRGSILPAGHSANAAYWFDNANGQWISSSFYMKELPVWVQAVNNRKMPDSFMQRGWKTLFPIETYIQSTADNKWYESKLPGEDNTFDHATETITNNKYDAFRHTPFGNSFTFSMAKAAIEGERLGKGEATDFLAVSFSSTDYIGHLFGPNSIEVEDMYLRFDREFADFLKYLDTKIGKGNYLMFITADHGAAHIPGFSKEHNIPAGVLDDADIKAQINTTLDRTFGLKGAISQIINYQLYLNDSLINNSKVDRNALKQFIIQELLKYPGISSAFELGIQTRYMLPAALEQMVINGYNQKLSGDIQFVFKPQWFDGWNTGTTHGVWAPYDSHIPLIWFGWNIKPGKLNRRVYMTDISVTLAALLKIQVPNGAIGEVIEEVVK
jgi:hypothetical protein